MKHTHKLLSLIFAVLFSCLFVNAGTNDTYTQIISPANGAEVVYEPNEGRFKITFVYYYNPTNSSKDVSLRSGSIIQAKVDGVGDITVARLNGDTDNQNVWLRDGANDSENGYLYFNGNFAFEGTISQSVSQGTAAKATIYYYPPMRALGKKISFYFNFEIEQDNDGEGHYWRSATKDGATLPNIEAGDFSASHAFGGLNKIDVTVNYKRGSIPVNMFWDGKEFISASITKEEELSASTYDKKISIKLNFSEKVTKIVEFIHTVEGLQNIENFNANYSSDGKVNLSWNLQAGNGKSDFFVIERADNDAFVDPITITSTLASSTTSYVDDLVEQDLYPSHLYYRITRSTIANVNGWGWNFGKDCFVKTDIKHVEITSAKAELFSGDSDTIKVTWEHNGIGNIWSKDSRFVIVRENHTAGTSQEISGLSYNDIKSCVYYDRAVQQCNTYSYNVYVEPGNKSFVTEAHSTEAFTPTKMGYLLNANASKGYFSDRVELDWETTGTYDKFSIFRKIYGTPDSNYKVVKTVDGTSVLTTYKDYDDTAEPGKVYDYKIEGSLQCSDSIIQSNPVYAVGFRTPTGDIYGRVTFENGQAEDSVEVYLESDVQAMGKSLFFNGTTASAIVNNFDALNQANEFTIQAWVKHDKQYGSVIRKADMYEIGFTNAGNIYFTVEGNRVETTDSYANVSEFIHITAQKTADALLIYVNGELVKEMQQTISMTANGNDLQFGGSSFVGYIDEVRFWNRALMATEISADYNRYIVGDERGLVAYYSFNYVVDTEFYDLSYLSSTYEYNEKHGKMINVELSDVIPTNAQLGYRAYTNTSGSYTIRAIPYVGSGTAYTIVPKKGIHQFSPQREDRYISNGAQEHTVNFTDVSSFEVTGTVTYEGGTYPVQGVHFLIDGIQVLDNKNQIVTTNANGEFSIQVPVGTHEVRAAKDGHTFLYDGRICDSDLRDLNYQDRVTGREIIDVTRVKYVGRVAGGTIQEAYPVGHGLSQNNLADNITITLTHQRMGYEMSSTEKTEYFKHELSNRNKLNVDSNRVVYGKETATISVNNETGEFVAYLIPEKFNVKVNVQGHTGIPGDNSEINLTQVFANQYAVNEWVDTVAMGSGDVQYKTVQDSVSYNFSQKFIHRVSPEIEIVQIDVITNEISPYFGAKEIVLSNMLGETDTVAVYSGNQYLFGKPIFEQGNFYKFKISVFEGYRYNGENTIVDRVPTQDASINFTNNLATETNLEALEVDSVSGIAYYTFQVDGPDLATGIKNMSARVTIETDNGSTSSFAWIPTNNFEAGQAYVLGGNPTGTNFVTGGPTKILTVLRDPPGSNSYAYLEKGTSVSTSSTYSGTVSQSGDTGAELGFKQQTFTWTGVGGGVMTSALETDASTTITALHEETYTGKETKATSTTFTTRFQTSDSPEYVGADADVYIGSATNLTFGQTNNISLMSKAQYDTLNNGVEEDLKTPLKAESSDGDWVLVQNDGTNIAQSFSTMFAYTQRHVLDVLIPNLQMVRDQYLMQYSDFSESDIEALQTMANAQDTTFYLSYFAPGHPDFGKSNSDATITDKSHGNPDDITNGPSYMIIYNKGLDNKEGVVVYPDTISFMNQSIKGWEKAIYDNEEAKVNANLLQNYSVQAGTNVEYSESYSGLKTHNSSFEIIIGVHVTSDATSNTAGAKVRAIVDEQITTTQGGEFESTVEQSHSKGFVLAEEGTDYLTVDVLREKNSNDKYDPGVSGGMVDEDDLAAKDYYSSFVFRTRGGVTSCPYEDAEVTQFYKPGTLLSEATVSMENPVIYAEKDFIENIPTGEPARFTIYMANESEAKEAIWANLKILDTSNPNGAKIYMDGTPIGSGRALIIPSGEVLTKTIEVYKGAVLNYDNLQLVLESQCQPSDNTDSYDDIADTLTIHVHYIKSCTDVEILQPRDNWTYNTKLDTTTVDGLNQHYMNVVIGNFDVNYTDFDHIELQYKAASESDDQYKTLISFYNDSALYNAALQNGMTAEIIKSSDGGKINYRMFMDNLPDQRYNLRAVSVCNIANELVYNMSEISSGIKDMYNPRLFGAAQPADGILSVEDEIRLNFNEPIAEGYLTKNNFQITGVRNGSTTDHSVAVVLDGADDYLATDVVRNLTAKNFTIEMWINADAQDATLFSHGNVNSNIALGITSDNHLTITLNGKTTKSTKAFRYDYGSWAHVAMVYTKEGNVSLYYNYDEILSAQYVGTYSGVGNIVVGCDINAENRFAGKLHNLRVWDVVRSNAELQLNSLAKLSGNEVGLMLYAPMNEAKGTVATDYARSSHLALYGCEWSVPEGYSTMFDGQTGYLALNTSAAVITSDMDFTIEFWFKAAENSKDAVMLSNGEAFGNNFGGSADKFEIGFNSKGTLYFANNSQEVVVDGEYADNDWHHIAVTAGRTQGRVQIYVDGLLKSYYEVDNIGSIANAFTYVGARGYQTDMATLVTVDKFFKGAVDEIRIWNLYKTASVVEEYMNKRLDGDEIGLIAYYPFEYYKEWQGATELDYTLQDQKIPTDPTQTAPLAIVEGAAIETMETAPILNQGPVSELMFNYVVNNDALIITLDEPSESIEKTIVTFVADGILDQNGNEIISPIIWTAYIDRNQLKWSQNEWTDSKNLYDEYEFTIDVINNGGSIINYEINNLPTWLSVDPQRNEIGPASVNHVTFTIREDLNVGTYNEVVYLTNEDNVNEPLYINLTVVGDKPQWDVNPSDYKYSMSVFGQMRFNNIFSDDENDILAAFNGAECVGVAQSQYNENVDMWYTMLTIYSNAAQGKALTFRMWDASTGITYQATPSKEIVFRNNAIEGTPDRPIIFDGQSIVYQDIVLNEGWNWVSFNLATPDLADINQALSDGDWSNGDQIKTLNKFADYSENKAKWQNVDWSLNNSEMYMIYSTKPQHLSMNGVVIDPTNNPITIKKKEWNYISYLPNKLLPIETALSGYEPQEGDVIKSIDKFAMYSRNNWIGSLEFMEPTVGYMLLNTSSIDKQLVYPTTATTTSYAPSAVAMPNSTNMGIIAFSDQIESGDVLYAVVDGVKHAKAVKVDVSRNTALQFISVSGEDVGKEIVLVLEKQNGTILTAKQTIPYKVNAVVGTIETPMLVEFEEEKLQNGNVTFSVYPNPADTYIDITFELVDVDAVDISIYDATGALVYESKNQKVVNAVLQHTVNVSSFASGNYVVQLKVRENIYTEKLIKL